MVIQVFQQIMELQDLQAGRWFGGGGRGGGRTLIRSQGGVGGGGNLFSTWYS